MDIKNARDLFAFTTGAQADVAREAFDEIESLRAERELLVAVAEVAQDCKTAWDNGLPVQAKSAIHHCMVDALTAWRER